MASAVMASPSSHHSRVDSGGMGGGAPGSGGDAGAEPAEPVDLTQLKLLVRRVARTFFDGPECIVLDYLTEMPQPIITDADLGQALRVGAREVNKFCARLVESRLLRMESKGEAKKADGKPIPRTFYVLDYKLFLNVIKWKLMMMDRNIRRRIERDMDSHGYLCPVCERKYTALEAQSRAVTFVNALGQPDFQFVCDAHPESPLDEDKNDDLVKQGNSHLHLLNMQNRPLLDLVYACDHLKLPAYNAAVVFEQMNARRKEAREAAAAAAAASGGLVLGGIGLAGATGAGDEFGTAAVRIEFTADGESERRRANELRALREKNTLPEWYRFSTVTGERVTGEEPADARANANALSASKAGGDGTGPGAGSGPDGGATDANHSGNLSDDYYKEYLSQVTSLAGSGSWEGEEPSPQQQRRSATGGHAKRTRSIDAEDLVDSDSVGSAPKRARMHTNGSVASRRGGGGGGGGGGETTSTEVEDDDEDEEFAHISSLGDYELTAEDQAVLREFEDDSPVSMHVSGRDDDDDDDEFDQVVPGAAAGMSHITAKVGGVDVPLSRIGDEERDKMTPEEYAVRYFQISFSACLPR